MASIEGNYGVDEVFGSSLQATDELGVPGGFTYACLDQGIEVKDITRLFFSYRLFSKKILGIVFGMVF